MLDGEWRRRASVFQSLPTPQDSYRPRYDVGLSTALLGYSLPSVMLSRSLKISFQRLSTDAKRQKEQDSACNAATETLCGDLAMQTVGRPATLPMMHTVISRRSRLL